MSRETKLMKNTAIIAIGNICTKGISFFLLPVYTALLSPEEYGTVDLLVTYASFSVIILTLQLEQGVFRYLVEARGNLQQQKRYITSALITVLAVLLLFLSVGYAVLTKLQYRYTGFFLAITTASVLTTLILQIPRGLDDHITYTVASSINGAAQVLLNALLVAVLRWGVAGVFTANMLASLLTMTFVVCRLRLARYIGARFFDRESLATMLKYSLPVIPYTVGWWVIGASDRVVIDLTIGVSYNGLYAIANKFPSLFQMVSGVFQTAWMESSFASFDTEDRNLYYNKVINRTVRAYSACNLGIIVLLPFVFPILIDPQYAAAYNYVPILTTAVMIHAASALYGAIYFAFKQTNKVAFSTALSAVINILVNVLLIRKIGLYAAAFSTLLSYAIILLMRYFEMKRAVGITISKSFLIRELTVYAVALTGYYAQNTVLQIVVATGVIIYCCLSNKELLLALLSALREYLRKGMKEKEKK